MRMCVYIHNWLSFYGQAPSNRRRDRVYEIFAPGGIVSEGMIRVS